MKILDVCEVYLYGWIFSLMCSCVPLQYMPEIIDNFRIFGWIYIYKLIVCLFLHLKVELMTTEGADEFL